MTIQATQDDIEFISKCICKSKIVGGPIDPQHTEPEINLDCPIHGKEENGK